MDLRLISYMDEVQHNNIFGVIKLFLTKYYLNSLTYTIKIALEAMHGHYLWALSLADATRTHIKLAQSTYLYSCHEGNQKVLDRSLGQRTDPFKFRGCGKDQVHPVGLK